MDSGSFTEVEAGLRYSDIRCSSEVKRQCYEDMQL